MSLPKPNGRTLAVIREADVNPESVMMDRRRRITLADCDIKGIAGDRLQVQQSGPQRRLSQVSETASTPPGGNGGNNGSGNNNNNNNNTTSSKPTNRKEVTAIRRMTMTGGTGPGYNQPLINIAAPVDGGGYLADQERQNLQDEIEKLTRIKSSLEEEVHSSQKQLHDATSRHDQLVIVVDRYKALYEAEVSAHLSTKEQLLQAESEVEMKTNELAKLHDEMESALKAARMKFKQKKALLLADKAREIELRDKKVDRLKQQMAQAFAGSSWERQQQLEELQKEMKKLHEESDVLRLKLRQSLKGPCQNCKEKENRDKNSQELIRTVLTPRPNSGSSGNNKNTRLTPILPRASNEQAANDAAGKLPTIVAPKNKKKPGVNSKTQQ